MPWPLLCLVEQICYCHCLHAVYTIYVKLVVKKGLRAYVNYSQHLISNLNQKCWGQRPLYGSLLVHFVLYFILVCWLGIIATPLGTFRYPDAELCWWCSCHITSAQSSINMHTRCFCFVLQNATSSKVFVLHWQLLL